MEPRSRPLRDPEAGLTIVEVMVAMLILVVGVLGTFTMIDGSLASTRGTTAREQGTNLARDLLERARQVPYASTANLIAPAALRAALPAIDNASTLAGSRFTVSRRGVQYTVSVFACSIDDPSDGIGVGGQGACAGPGVVTTPGTPPTGTVAVGANVLGIAVTAGGSLLGTVCNLVGTNTSVANALSGVLNPVVPVSVCPTAGGPGSVAFDSQPDDLRQVRVTVQWTQNGPQTLTQTTLLTNQAG